LKLYPQAIGWDREDVDVLDFAALRKRIADLEPAPDAVINCAAFNDVDGAEDFRERAFALNGDFVGELARFTREAGVPLVHYSSNYVFDGTAGEYAEGDEPAPLSVYGRSKRRGEELLLAAGGQAYVVRTAVIFGPKGESELSKRSFVELMLDLAARRDTIQAVADEINSVTYAPDLAAATRDLMEDAPPAGIYHLVNDGAASWCDFAREIFRIAGREVNVIPVSSATFPRKAARPAKAVLRNTRRPRLRHWTASLADFLRQ